MKKNENLLEGWVGFEKVCELAGFADGAGNGNVYTQWVRQRDGSD
jgi:hypothetical protein